MRQRVARNPLKDTLAVVGVGSTEYGRDLGVTGYPETFLIDREGRIAAARRGPVTQAWLDEHLEALL